MPDYSKAKIYTVRCKTDHTLIYVGSTIQPLSVRFAGHKKKSQISLYKYVKTKHNGDWSEWYIELYEDFPCETLEQLHKREGEVMRQIATINQHMLTGLTLAESLEFMKTNPEQYNLLDSKYTEFKKNDIKN